MSDKSKEALGFTLIILGAIMLFIAIVYNLTNWLGELYAINIMSVSTLILGIIFYKTYKVRNEENIILFSTCIGCYFLNPLCSFVYHSLPIY